MPRDKQGVHMGRGPREDEGRGGVKLLQAQEHQRLPASRQKLGKNHGSDFLSQPSKGINPNILISDLQLQELWDNKFLWFKPLSLE